MLLEDLAAARPAQFGARLKDRAAPCARVLVTQAQTLSPNFRLHAHSQQLKLDRAEII